MRLDRPQHPPRRGTRRRQRDPRLRGPLPAAAAADHRRRDGAARRPAPRRCRSPTATPSRPADGGLIAVRAAPEPLAEVAAEGAALARLAWHVGNRHAPAQIGERRLRDPPRPRARGDAGAARRHGAAGDGAVHPGGRRLRPRPHPRPPPRPRRTATTRRSGRDASPPCRCSRPGSRRPTRSAPTATRTGSSGRSRPAGCATATASRPGSPTCVEFGAGRSDAILLARAMEADDPAPLAELAAALAPSAERLLETTAQGAAFARTTSAAWAGAGAGDALPGGGRPRRAAARAAGARDRDALPPGLRRQPRLGRRAAGPGRPDRGPADHRGPAAARRRGRRGGARPRRSRRSAAPRLAADLAAMLHETQYTRLYRS